MRHLPRWLSLVFVVGLTLLLGQPADGGGASVYINNFTYIPQLISVTAGESVTWYNQDHRYHTIISETGAFYSGPIAPGRFFAVLFQEPGVYPYKDNFYPALMRGIVVVNPPVPPPAPGPTPTLPSASATNLALGRPARASDAQSSFPPANVVDGRGDTAWGSLGGGHPGLAQWLQVDLGSALTFNQAAINWGSSYATEYVLFIWANGRWLPIAGHENSDGGNDILNFPPTQARYVRLWLFYSSSLSGEYRVNELALYHVTEAVNVALGQRVVAQGYEGSGWPAYAVDGDPATAWQAPPYLPQFLYVDLQAPYAVERVVARWGPGQAPPAVGLYGWDQSRWYLIERRDPAPDIEQTFVLSRTLTLTQVMLQAEPAGSVPPPDPPPTSTVGVALRELEIYGRASAGPGLNPSTPPTRSIERAQATPGP